MASYYFTKTLKGNFDDTITKVTEALKTEGFGVLTEIDIKSTLKKKLDVDYIIIKYWVRAIRHLHTRRCRRKIKSAPCSPAM